MPLIGPEDPRYDELFAAAFSAGQSVPGEQAMRLRPHDPKPSGQSLEHEQVSSKHPEDPGHPKS